MEAKSDASEWSNTYDNIKNIHDVAYKCIENAITLEEREKPLEVFAIITFYLCLSADCMIIFTLQALDKYKEGIDLIDQALNIRVSCPGDSDPSWDKACNIIHKLKRTRAEVLTRINCLKAKYETPAKGGESSPENGDSTTVITYRELGLALRDLSVRNFKDCDTSIIYINNEAKFYYISPDGTVLSMSDYQELKIFGIEGRFF